MTDQDHLVIVGNTAIDANKQTTKLWNQRYEVLVILWQFLWR